MATKMYEYYNIKTRTTLHSKFSIDEVRDLMEEISDWDLQNDPIITLDAEEPTINEVSQDLNFAITPKYRMEDVFDPIAAWTINDWIIKDDCVFVRSSMRHIKNTSTICYLESLRYALMVYYYNTLSNEDRLKMYDMYTACVTTWTRGKNRRFMEAQLEMIDDWYLFGCDQWMYVKTKVQRDATQA